MTSTPDSGLSNGDASTDGSISPTTSSSSSSEDGLKTAVTIIPDVFFFMRSDTQPEPRDDVIAFNVDNELIYDSFFDDFGPLNIAKVFRYCEKVQKLLQPLEDDSVRRKIVHFSSLTDDRKFVNSAWLVGAFSIIKRKKTPEEIIPLLEEAAQKSMIPFRDASCGPATYKLPLKDCLHALHRALQLHFFVYDTFDLREYEFYERVENGDFNWITPKLLAFCGPHQRTKLDGYPVHAPEEYFTYFKKHNVSTIVRLNSPQYNAERFTAAGFDHKDLIFPDGTSPADHILQEFLRIVETAKGGVATHCKAGLGRTGTLIAAYIMKHNHFSPSEAIAWTRIVRPGSVIGQQQHYLEAIKDKAWMEGGATSSLLRPSSTSSVNGDTELLSEQNNEEIVETSTTSTEIQDEAGRTTFHEITIVKKTTVSTVEVPESSEISTSKSEEDVDVTQGDVLNIKKAMRDKARQERCSTRSMGARSLTADEQPPTPPLNDKLQKPKKLKTR